MKNKFVAMFVISSMICIGIISIIPNAISEDTWGCKWTQNPRPGYYKEQITFTGTTGCPNPVNWTWTFQPGNVKRYHQQETYLWAPYWTNASYGVSLQVRDNITGQTAGYASFAPVKIWFDAFETIDTSPLNVHIGTLMTFTAVVYNQVNTHILPAGYTVMLDVVTWPGHAPVFHCADITGPADIISGAHSTNLYRTWLADGQGWYCVKMTVGTTYQQTFDSDRTNNVEYSYPFYVWK